MSEMTSLVSDYQLAFDYQKLPPQRVRDDLSCPKRARLLTTGMTWRPSTTSESWWRSDHRLPRWTRDYLATINYPAITNYLGTINDLAIIDYLGTMMNIPRRSCLQIPCHDDPISTNIPWQPWSVDNHVSSKHVFDDLALTTTSPGRPRNDDHIMETSSRLICFEDFDQIVDLISTTISRRPRPWRSHLDDHISDNHVTMTSSIFLSQPNSTPTPLWRRPNTDLQKMTCFHCFPTPTNYHCSSTMTSSQYSLMTTFSKLTISYSKTSTRTIERQPQNIWPQKWLSKMMIKTEHQPWWTPSIVKGWTRQSDRSSAHTLVEWSPHPRKPTSELK